MRLLKRVWVEITSFFETDELRGEEINLKKLSIIFLLGLFFLFGSYFLTLEENIREIHDFVLNMVDKFKSVYNFVFNIIGKLTSVYNIMYDSITSFMYQKYHFLCNFPIDMYIFTRSFVFKSAVSEIEDIDSSYKSIGCKGCKIELKLETQQDKMMWVVDYELSHKGRTWRQMHKVFERVFGVPVDFGWVQIRKDLSYADWSRHKAISLMVKGTGKPSNLEFSVTEEDRDVWYYFDKTSLSLEDWVEVRMPFEDFVNPKWASHGDGKKEFKNITRMDITITNFDMSVNNTIYLSMGDGEIYSFL